MPHRAHPAEHYICGSLTSCKQLGITKAPRHRCRRALSKIHCTNYSRKSVSWSIIFCLPAFFDPRGTFFPGAAGNGKFALKSSELLRCWPR
nr:MAG TPA: hypothetical protein [Caudoviricetes sp.]